MSKDLNHSFLKFLESNLKDFKQKRFLLAVSGGVDSMVMLDLFLRNSLSVAVAHCNFQLRGGESDKDELFIENFTKQKDVSFYSIKFQTNEFAGANSLSIQMAARQLRYDWFDKLQKELDVDLVCTAHHLNDSMETSLFNLVKGTGFRGVSGMDIRRGPYFRPLLSISKGEILQYATDRQLTWREDESNQENYYHRNYLRNKVIPLLKEVNPGFPEQSESTLSRLRGSSTLLTSYLEIILRGLVRTEDEVQFLSVDQLRTYASDEYAVILDFWLTGNGFNFSQVLEIADSLQGQSGKRFESESHIVLKDRDQLILYPREAPLEKEVMIMDDEGEFYWSKKKVKYRVQDREGWELSRLPQILQLDYNALEKPLKIRSWKEGDYFYPLGMKGKKKISDFMIDRKIPVNFKTQYPVLESGENIAGILGLQVDERFKIRDPTDKIFVIEIDHA